MEEQVKTEQVVVEVEEKKKWWTKKKIVTVGLSAVGLLGAGALWLIAKGKDHENEGHDNSNVVDVDYEPVESGSDVSQQND